VRSAEKKISPSVTNERQHLEQNSRRIFRPDQQRAARRGDKRRGHTARYLQLPDGARYEVTYVKVKSRKGKTTRWFWTPDSAVLITE